MRAGFIVPAVVLALIGLGAAWFLTNFERVAVKERVGPSGEARLREFLAAQRFAERMGMKVSEVRSLPELAALPQQGALIVPHRRQQLPPARLDELVQWVDHGGHLIVEAEAIGLPDPLLERLGVKRSVEAARKPAVARLEVAETDVRLRAGGNVVSYARGRGLVTVAATLGFARNPSIGALDHAELLWSILSLTSGREPLLAPRFELRVYFRPERLSLWDFLQTHAAPALAAGGLLLALWLWSIAPRFGPVAPDAPPGRRRLLDHLRASGRYYWAKGLRARLVLAARDAALRRVARAQPDFAAAPPDERASRLASLMNTSTDEAKKFLLAGGAMRGAEFIQLAQHAQRVHSGIEKGAKQ